MFDHLPYRKSKDYVGCVYAIINTTNGHLYIGGTTNPRQRMQSHFCDLKRNKHHNDLLQEEFNRDGIKSFRIEVISQFSDVNTGILSEKVKKAELETILTMRPYYNIKLPVGFESNGNEYANVCIEAIDVFNKTGLTPSQLLQQLNKANKAA